MINWGLGDANVIYGMFASGTPFWRHARERGVKVAADVFITPLWHNIVMCERVATVVQQRRGRRAYANPRCYFHSTDAAITAMPASVLTRPARETKRARKCRATEPPTIFARSELLPAAATLS